MVWSTLPDGSHDYYNAEWYEFTGVLFGSTDGEGWNAMFHPDDQERAWTAWRASLASGLPYEIEYRLRRHDGVYRWTLGRARAIRDANGTIMRWVGTCTDIDDDRRLAELNTMLSSELGHRIKNLFAVVGSLVHLTSRTFPGFAEPADDLQQRIGALGRAHDYVRPRDDEAAPRSLRGMLDALLAPYPARDDGRLTISGADVALGGDAATSVALIVHELATNAVKHGALSDAGGSIAVAIITGPTTTLIWRESCNRPLPVYNNRPLSVHNDGSGFGTGLIDLSVRRQLGGMVTRDWNADGLTVTIEVPTERLG